jgi:serine/threonine protein kinase
MFWKMHSSSKPVGYYSDEFKSLITSMLAYDPVNRLSIADIVGHPWFESGELEATDA